MTTEELIARARHLFEFGRKRIEQTGGELAQQFHLLRRDGDEEVIALAGEVMNSSKGKAGVGRMIRARIASGDVEAVLMLSDTWLSFDMTVEKDKVRKALGLTVKEAADAGMCTVGEHVMVVLETPVLYWGAHRHYRRVDRRIEWAGEIQMFPDQARGRGIFAGYWPETGGKQ